MMSSEHDHDLNRDRDRDRDLEMSGVGHVPAPEHSATNGTGEDVKTSSVDEVEHSASAGDPEKHGNVKIVKTDDSDGRVEWSARQIVATVSLSMLYVGA
jgi:hypothetical protein